MVWVAAVILILVYVGIWLAITRIPKTVSSPPLASPQNIVEERTESTHMRIQSSERFRLDLHAEKEMDL